MKIVVQKNNLQKALGFVERVASKNAALPILNNVLLKTENGRLLVAATNLEIGVVSFIGAKVTEEGAIAVPGRILAEFIKGVRSETVELHTKQNTLSVDAGTMKTAILCFDASEYPIIPKINQKIKQTLPVVVLHGMITNIIDSIASSESRPELAGAFLDFQKGHTVLAATDSFRLVEQKRENSSTTPATMIIPRTAVMELFRILPDLDGDITINIDDNQIEFTHNDCQLISRLVNGRYPDYRKIIPEKIISKALVSKEEIENSVKTTALFSSNISDVKIECSADELKVSAKNASKGEAHATTKANLKGDPFEIMVNYRYLLDGLKVIPTNNVILEFTGKGSPFVLRPSDDKKESVYLIMPLRN